MKVGLLGAGTIGGGVDRILDNAEDIEVVKVLSLVVDDRIKDRLASSIDEIADDPEIDTVVEVMGGVHPAFEFVSKCMKKGKNAVTANKALVAAYYKELIQIAKENNVSFRASAAVGGGIPWLINLERVKRMDTVTEIGGIMNGTTNFIMNNMTVHGSEFDDVLKEAQNLGYAEKDPAADIDGLDIRRKLDISANIAWDIYMNEEEIPTLGIRYISKEDVGRASVMDKTIKLMAYGKKTEEGIEAYVEPTFLPPEDIAASIPLNYNVLYFAAKNGGVQRFIGEGAGRFPTAANVVQDLVDVKNTKPSFYTEKYEDVHPMNDTAIHSYYVNFKENDPYLNSIMASTVGDAILTKPVSVSEMHAWVNKKLSEGKHVFVAGIR